MSDTEWCVEAIRIYDWRRLRDEIAPAFTRDFAGAIVHADERTVASSTPGRSWSGASLVVLGLNRRTARYMANALKHELGFRVESMARVATGDEMQLVREHRRARSARRSSTVDEMMTDTFADKAAFTAALVRRDAFS